MRFPIPHARAACLAALLAACQWDNSGFPVTDPKPDPKVEPQIETPVDPVKTPAAPEQDFAGCWRVVFRGDSGRIRAWQKGKEVGGFLAWDSGGVDTLGGNLGFPYLRLEARGDAGDRVYLGNMLRTVQHFETKLLGTPNGRLEKLNGDRIPCGVDSLPAP
jgi:hypothetical protein